MTFWATIIGHPPNNPHRLNAQNAVTQTEDFSPKRIKLSPQRHLFAKRGIWSVSHSFEEWHFLSWQNKRVSLMILSSAFVPSAVDWSEDELMMHLIRGIFLSHYKSLAAHSWLSICWTWTLSSLVSVLSAFDLGANEASLVMTEWVTPLSAPLSLCLLANYSVALPFYSAVSAFNKKLREDTKTRSGMRSVTGKQENSSSLFSYTQPYASVSASGTD